MEPTFPPQPETKSNKVPQIIAVLVLIVLIVFGLNKSFTKTDSNITAQVADTTPPVTTVTSPADGQIISGNFSTCATATDNVGVVTIVLHMGGIPASGTTSPLCAGWNTVNFANGFYTVYSTASDAAGNTGTSPAILAGVANNLTTPIVKATMPAPSAIVSGQVTLGAKAYAPAGLARVDFLIDGTSTVVATATTPSSLNTYTAVWNSTTVVNGSHNIIAKVYDSNGLSMVSGTTFTVTNNGTDTTPPVISAITSSSITTTGATLSWTTNEASNSQIVYGTTTAYGSVWPAIPDAIMVTAHSLQLSGLTSNTLYHFAVKSADAAGNLATSGDQTFMTTTAPDTTPPTVSLIAPTAGSTISGTTTLTATASDNVGVTRVDFYNSNTLLGSDTTAPYSYDWNTTTVSYGTKSLKAKAYDAAGNVNTSSIISVTLKDITPPTVTITSPTSTVLPQTGIVTISATASDPSGIKNIKILVDGVQKKQCTTSTSCSYNWSMTGVATGSHMITVTSQDKAPIANTGTATKTVTK